MCIQPCLCSVSSFDRGSRFLTTADSRGLWPLEEAAAGGATNEPIGSLDNAFRERSQDLESRGGEVNLVGLAGSAVVNDTNNDRAMSNSDLGTLEADGFFTALVSGHVHGADVPAIGSIDMAITQQVTIASNLYPQQDERELIGFLFRKMPYFEG